MINQLELSISKNVVTVHGIDSKGHERSFSILSESLIELLENPPAGVAVICKNTPPEITGGVVIPVRVVKQNKSSTNPLELRDNDDSKPTVGKIVGKDILDARGVVVNG